MNYSQFRSLMAKRPYFRSNIFAHMTKRPDILRIQLVEWVKKGLVIALKRGLYTLNAHDREVGLSAYALASVLYTPSYISLETALSVYQMIPERVNLITSITLKKTQSFNNAFGDYHYRHIKKSCFQGFISQQDEFGNNYYIATPEKALVDLLYFKLRGLAVIEADWFELSLRLQNVEILDMKKLQKYAELFQQKKLKLAISLFRERYD